MTFLMMKNSAKQENSLLMTASYAVPKEIQLEENIALKARVLIWRNSFSGPSLGWRKVKPHPDMLNEFCKLADAKDEEILKYALRYGVLNLCRKHWLPASHNSSCRPLEDTTNPRGEPITGWRDLARVMQSTINIADKLAEGKVADSKEWRVFIENDWLVTHNLLEGFRKDEKKFSEALRFQRRRIADMIDLWIAISAIRPKVGWDAESVSFAFMGDARSHLCGVLVSQLLLIVGRTGVVCCSECRSWYAPPKRRPKKHQRNYCPDCKARKIPERNAKRAQREREKNLVGQA